MSRIKQGLQFVAGGCKGAVVGGAERDGVGLAPQTVIKTSECPCGRVWMWRCFSAESFLAKGSCVQGSLASVAPPQATLSTKLNVVLSPSDFSSKTPR